MPDFVAGLLGKSIEIIRRLYPIRRRTTHMFSPLYDTRGRRKYLILSERRAFVRTAIATGGPVATFCIVLAYCGPRLSEGLNLSYERIDSADGTLVFETLKRRTRGMTRAVPVPRELLEKLEEVHGVDIAQ